MMRMYWLLQAVLLPVLLPVLLLSLLTGCSAAEAQNKKQDNSFILTNINIVDVENQRILPARNITVIDGKIKTISKSLAKLDKGSNQLIDGENGFITPGLIDMHVHMYEPAAYVLTLSHGVTHVRIMNGIAEQLIWRDNIETGLMLGSTSTVSSPIISGNEDALLQHAVSTRSQAQAAVNQYYQQGYDLIKAYGSLNQESLMAIVEEGKRLGMPVAKHGPHPSGNMTVAELAGLQSFEHVEDIFQGPLAHQFDSKRLPAILAEIKDTKVPVTPTLNIFNQLTMLSQQKQAYLDGIPEYYTPTIIRYESKNNQVERWLGASTEMTNHNQKTLQFLKDITRDMHHAGIPLLVGSDSGVLLSPHGLATHQEMALLKESGLSVYEVLAAATINPAKALNMDEEIGKIAPGFQADFIYTVHNPIHNLSALIESEAVIKHGVWFSRDELNDLRNEAIDSRSFWQELRVLLEAL